MWEGCRHCSEHVLHSAQCVLCSVQCTRSLVPAASVQLKTWDLRSNSRECVSSASHSGTGVTCLARHPTQVLQNAHCTRHTATLHYQAHILVSGGSDGVMGVWDLRSVPSGRTNVYTVYYTVAQTSHYRGSEAKQRTLTGPQSLSVRFARDSPWVDG